MDGTPPTLHEVRNISLLASELRASEIIKLAGEIKAKIAAGAKIYNYTIGDFDPKIFPIPTALKDAIIEAYKEDQTNYPPSNGIESLRNTLSAFIEKEQGLAYEPDAFLVAGGGRPLIYAAFQAILDREEPALFPVPSWNNNHYTTLTHGRQIAVETTAEAHFMPTAAMLEPHISEAGIVALCSPLNPTGTVFSEAALREICDLILLENKRRNGVRKPLYLIYDQIYWQLCFGDTKHIDPVSINPAMRPYTIFIDGISKAYGATGVRVGWAFGPRQVIDKMKSILGHVGAWAPKPEQVGTSNFMSNQHASSEFLRAFKSSIHARLDAFYRGFIELKRSGLPVDAIAPQAAIYLTVKIDLTGRSTPEGDAIQTVEDTTRYILDKAGLALVPFTAFGADKDSTWYRLSVGTVNTNDIPVVLDQLRKVIEPLK